MDKVIDYMPINIKNYIYTFMGQLPIEDEIQEIRLRCNKPIVLKLKESTEILKEYITDK